jgi:hypothetical protein
MRSVLRFMGFSNPKKAGSVALSSTPEALG